LGINAAWTDSTVEITETYGIEAKGWKPSHPIEMIKKTKSHPYDGTKEDKGLKK